ncbi:MAG: FxsA family protein, partial [Actinomycetota bacterium]
AAIARGEPPSSEIADGFLILFGGALLLTPGFITDLLGLVVLLPPTRLVVKRSLRRAGGWLFLRRFGVFRP